VKASPNVIQFGQCLGDFRASGNPVLSNKIKILYAFVLSIITVSSFI
jgi:hypothetical protein